MNMVNVNEFRSRMKDFMDKADSGEEVVLSRSKGRYYKLVSYASREDMIMEKLREMSEKVDIGKVILFGSRARGDARPDSDWDLLLVLDSTHRNHNADFDRYAFPFVEYGWEIGEEINPVIYTREDWDKYSSTPFIKNVRNEGVELC